MEGKLSAVFCLTQKSARTLAQGRPQCVLVSGDGSGKMDCGNKRNGSESVGILMDYCGS